MWLNTNKLKIHAIGMATLKNSLNSFFSLWLSSFILYWYPLRGYRQIVFPLSPIHLFTTNRASVCVDFHYPSVTTTTYIFLKGILNHGLDVNRKPRTGRSFGCCFYAWYYIWLGMQNHGLNVNVVIFLPFSNSWQIWAGPLRGNQN